MAKDKIAQNKSSLNPTIPTSGDPVSDLYAVAASLDIIRDGYRSANRDGEANLLDLIARQVFQAAEQIDGEDWQAVEVTQ